MNGGTAVFIDDAVTLYHGDCRAVMASLGAASVDAIVTDPPYGLEFMGKEWDKFAPEVAQPTRSGWDKPTTNARISNESGAHGRVAFHKRRHTFRCSKCQKRDAFRNKHECAAPWEHEWTDPVDVGALTFQAWFTEVAIEAYRVLKPGGHLLAFGGTRTWHRLAVAIEDAGFEVRDSMAWLYGSGFPKSLDVSKAIDNAAGKIRPDRVTSQYGGNAVFSATKAPISKGTPVTPEAKTWQGWGTALKPAFEPIVVARKPLDGTVAENVLRHGTGALNIDGCRIGTDGGGTHCTNRDSQGKCKGHDNAGRSTSGATVHGDNTTAGRWPANVILDESQAAELDRQSGVTSSKASAGRNGADDGGSTWNLKRADDEVRGHTDTGGASRFFYVPKANKRERPREGDTAHPTVKPLALMRYLVKLVTPPGGTVLEPFAGSGTTAEACVLEGFRCIAIEMTDDYLPLIIQRLERVERGLW